MSSPTDNSESEHIENPDHSKGRDENENIRGMFEECVHRVVEAIKKAAEYVVKIGEAIYNAAAEFFDSKVVNTKDSDNSEDQDKNEKTEGIIESVIHNAAVGFVVGAVKNAAHYIVKIGGRKSNIVTVFDKTVKSSLGNPKWFARVDMPHGNVPFHHINVNPAITGVKDPHIFISATAAKVAGFLGHILNFINKVAPYLMVAVIVYEGVEIGLCVYVDVKNSSSRNTVKKIIMIIAAVVGGLFGVEAGAAIGNFIFPGIGMMVGGLIGAVVGSVGFGIGTDILLEFAFDYFRYGIEDKVCEKCGKVFECRRYQEGDSQKLCHDCRKK
ncbi:hypothetical protein CAEBREN_16607 [Caenorhabditis brenneri]|uniref:Uncharacterized protein n=1 Tax=Caenorhabditis brenneri TaxID=135651 RepID=G0N3B9_CAEBE|nr:hypothetical protein CAEBREN_16607 [Caenorhabditis brenneri]